MPPNSEIEKLERRWKENPKGTFFAPYAEVLRKNGEFGSAREVLGQGLGLHPNHIPGNIVLGRCCLDMGEDGPAEVAFTHVLELDAENVIALKALGEITERQGRLMEAVSWLARLLAVDPSNDEARDQLKRVEAAREAAAAGMLAAGTAAGSPSAAPSPAAPARPSGPPPVAASPKPSSQAGSGTVTDPGKTGPVRQVTVRPEPQAPPASPPQSSPRPAAAEALPRSASGEDLGLEPLELDLPRASREIPQITLEGLQVDEAFTSPPDSGSSVGEATQAEGLDHFGVGMEPSGRVSPNPGGHLPSAEGLEHFGVEKQEDLELRAGGGGEFHMPDDSSALLAGGAGGGVSEFQVPDASAELGARGGGSDRHSGSKGAGAPDSSRDPSSVVDDLFAEPSPPSPARASAPPPAARPPRPPEPSDEPTIRMIPTGPSAAAKPQGQEGPEEESRSELKFIMPDEVDEPPPPRVRRLSQEMPARQVAVEPEPEAEPEPGEPAPVVTESMAELYLQQGHVAEALSVYQTLAARQPNNPRLAERVRALQARQASGGGRRSYAAVETGGESVESFFKTLAGSRPGSESPPPESREDAQGVAPEEGGTATRPSSDPLSLSALFGEEPAPAPPPPSPAPEPPSRPAGPDAFSFDQFFGGDASPPGGAPPQPMPSDDDLDQFQHWLRSLKR